MVDKQALPQAAALDAISPATRLLEKRRLMYENQEKYIMKKKEVQQAEISFRLTEKELRDKDQEIQEALINFAAYLDANTKVVKKCDDNIKALERENLEKEQEIAKKTRLLKILKSKSDNIKNQKVAVQKYNDFLDDVRNANSDEFTEVNHILDRYKVLKDSQTLLDQKLRNVDNEIKQKQKDINSYKRTMDNEILSLHNDIETLKVRYDDRQRARVNNKNNEEQSNAEQSKKVQEISRVVMALDNLEKVFINQTETTLKYTHKNVDQNVGERSKEDEFNLNQKTLQVALAQLEVFALYLKMYRAVVDGFDEKYEEQRQKRKDEFS